MDLTSRRMTTALKTAIRREERTAASYQEKAAKMQDPQAKKVLESLAKQEIGHGKKLKLILDKGLDLSHLGRRKTTRKMVEDLRVLNDDVRKIEQTSESAKVLAKAIKAEENSCKLYRSLEKIFAGADVAELFGKLAEEEEKHAARLQKALAKM